MTATETLAAYIRAAQNIVFFGGAGVSTESGVPLRAGKDLEIQGSIGEIFTQVDQLLHDA